MSERVVLHHTAKLVAEKPVVRAIMEAGGHVYLVGGIVRDICAGNEDVNDIDIVVCGLSEDTMKKAITKAGAVAEMKGESFGIYMVDGLDIAHARTDRQPGTTHTDIEVTIDPYITIEEDLMRRDFTINAIAYSINDDELIDPYGGVKDIRRKVIRMVDHRAFIDDPLRIVRALQFKARFAGFVLSPNTERAVKRAKGTNYKSKIAGERIYAELKKVWDKCDCEEFIEYFADEDDIERRQPKIFEDLIFQLFQHDIKNGYSLTTSPRIVATANVEKACRLLHDCYNNHTTRIYELFPKVIEDYPQLLNSAYIPESFKHLNKQCLKRGIPRTLKELNLLHGINGATIIKENPGGITGIEIGKKLDNYLIEELKTVKAYWR